MSINMKINFRWGICLNLTDFEWSDLQHEIADIMEKQYTYQFSQAFKEIEKFSYKKTDLILYARMKEKSDFEFIITKAENQSGDPLKDTAAEMLQFLEDLVGPLGAHKLNEMGYEISVDDFNAAIALIIKAKGISDEQE